MISGKATISNSSLEEILSMRKTQEEGKDVMVIPDDCPDPVTGAASTAPSLADLLTRQVSMEYYIIQV